MMKLIFDIEIKHYESNFCDFLPNQVKPKKCYVGSYVGEKCTFYWLRITVIQNLGHAIGGGSSEYTETSLVHRSRW